MKGKIYSTIEECQKDFPKYIGVRKKTWIDLTGYKFNNWTILYYTKDANKVACKCDCGTIKMQQLGNIKSGKSKSCGCLNLQVRNLAGQKFGRLTVQKQVPAPRQINQHGAWWHCKCDCGNEIDVISKSLTYGSTQSCGCLFKESARLSILNYNLSEKNRLDLTNKKFGRLTAIKPIGRKDNDTHIYWLCKCDCGNFHEVNTTNLTKGNVQSCGCLNSVNEGIIKNMLQQNNYTFKEHSQIIINQTKRFFDFEVIINNKNYYIEYDGSQHFTGYGKLQSLDIIRKRDLSKNKYCFENNIPLIRIPYDAEYTIDDLKLETTRFLLTPENEEEYYNRK